MRTRWQRYWFPDGGRCNAGVARIAVAASTLLMLGRLRGHALIVAPDQAPVASYDPVGVLMLLPGAPPPAALVTAAYAVAWLASTALLLGAWTRVAAALGLAASLVVVSFAVSFTPDWPHDNNLPLLALVAVQGTRGGDVLGLDGWCRRRRGLPPPPADGYEWTPRLVQLVAALVFLAAAAFKLGSGRFTLDWALSDNLRHQILAQFDVNHLPRTAVADWLIAEPWRYRTAALLNLANQLLPVFACLSVRRPRLRAVFGLCFLAEVVGIGLVMGLWDLHWLPLVAVFVDWDRLLAWARRRSPAAAATTSAPAPRLAATARRRISIFLVAFIGYDVLISFAYPRLDQRLRTYPFSAYPMFAIIRAKRPYDTHRDYQFVHGRFRVLADDPAAAAAAEDWIHQGFVYRKLHKLDDPAVLRERLAQVSADLRARFPDLAFHAVQLWATIYDVPAYPAPARLAAHDVGLMGELTVDGRWTSALGRLEPYGPRWAAPAPPGLELRDARLVAHVDGELVPRPLPLARAGDRLVFDPPPGAIVLVALHAAGADGKPLTLLLGRRTRRAWW